MPMQVSCILGLTMSEPRSENIPYRLADGIAWPSLASVCFSRVFAVFHDSPFSEMAARRLLYQPPAALKTTTNCTAASHSRRKTEKPMAPPWR